MFEARRCTSPVIAPPVISFLLICLAGLLGCVTAPRLEGRLNEIDALVESTSSKEISDVERQAIISKRYTALIAPEIRPDRLQSLSAEELLLVYRTVSEAGFYSLVPQHARDLAQVVAEFERRKLAQVNHFKGLYRAYIRTRLFSEARAVYQQHPYVDTDALPRLETRPGAVDGVASEWVFASQERVAVRQAVSLNADWQVIVVSHPACHFSNNAMQAIGANASLMQRLGTHIKWVAPQDSNFNFEQIQAWNQNHPKTPVTVVHRAAEWPLAGFSATPTFYFLRNGSVVETFSGWPAEGNRQKFNEALDRLTLGQ